MANVSSTAAPYRQVERIELGNRLLRRREVELKTGKSRSAIYAGVRNGTFPAPVPIGDKSVDEETELADVVQTMQKHAIKRVPVLRDGRLVGLVSRADLLSQFLAKKGLDSR